MYGGFRILVLGPVDVETPNGPHHIGSRNERAVLAALAMTAGRSLPVSQLRDVVWPEDPPTSSDGAIHTYVSRLRHLLGPDAIERVDHAYQLVADRSQIDAVHFEDLVDAASEARSDPRRCADLCHEALALWRGMPFGDLGDEEPFRLESLRLDELRVAAMELALGAEIELGHHEVAAAELESAVREHPYRERLWYLLIEALRRDDRRIEALQACARLREVLIEAGLDAGPELLELERRIAGPVADGID
jgi:DNA-binding SARP family transcriptional activator